MQKFSTGGRGSVTKASETTQQPDIGGVLVTRRETLLQELRELDAALALVHQEYSVRLQSLQTRKKPVEEALHHIDALLRLEGHTNTNQSCRDFPCSEDVAAGTSVTDAVLALLEEAHQPLHYRDMVVKLQERNIYVPGKDPAATLLSRINRDNRFKRDAKRGVYGLATWRMQRSKPRRAKGKRAKK